MARRSSTQESNETQTETPETVAEEQAPESTETGADSTDQSTETETDESNGNGEVDLTEFQAALQAAVEARNEDDGSVPDDQLEAVNKVFSAIPNIKGRNKARKLIEEGMTEAVGVQENIVLARAFIAVRNALTSKSTPTERAPADPTQAFIQRVAVLRLARAVLQSAVPEGVSDDWSTGCETLVNDLQPQIATWREWISTDHAEDAEDPDVSPVVKAAFKLTERRVAMQGAIGTTNRTYSGPRRSVPTHVTEVFENLEPGTFLTVLEISKANSAEYGDDHPSPGAVSAYLFPQPDSKGNDRTPKMPEGLEREIGDKSRGVRKSA